MASPRDFSRNESVGALYNFQTPWVIRLAKEAKSVYHRHPRAKERLRSATTLVKGLLEMPGLTCEHRREFLKLALWKVTEAEGRTKYKTRLRSPEAHSNSHGVKLEHDHVFQRSLMVEALLSASPEAVDTIIKRAVGCTITKQEHDRLKQFKKLDGWERYRKAEIVVVDTLTGEDFHLPVSVER
jgi:hypothetical protein